jgi:hypothetical protein
MIGGRAPIDGPSHRLKVICRGLTFSGIGHEIVLDLLSLVQPSQPSPLDGADMDERIRAAAVLRDEAEAFLGVEPFHGAGRPVCCAAQRPINKMVKLTLRQLSEMTMTNPTQELTTEELQRVSGGFSEVENGQMTTLRTESQRLTFIMSAVDSVIKSVQPR